MEIDMRNFLRDRDRQVRAEVAESIAQLLDDLSEACGEDEEHFKVAYSTAAQVARIKGAQTHTQPAETLDQMKASLDQVSSQLERIANALPATPERESD